MPKSYTRQRIAGVFDMNVIFENGSTGTWLNPTSDNSDGAHLTVAAEVQARSAFMNFVLANQ